MAKEKGSLSVEGWGGKIILIIVSTIIGIAVNMIFPTFVRIDGGFESPRGIYAERALLREEIDRVNDEIENLESQISSLGDRINRLENPPEPQPPPPPEEETVETDGSNSGETEALPMFGRVPVIGYSRRWNSGTFIGGFIAPYTFTSLAERYEHGAFFGSGSNIAGSIEAYAIFSLVGQNFTTITGVLGHIDGLTGAQTYFRVYEVSGGVPTLLNNYSFPVYQNMLRLPVELDISGVNILKFRLSRNGNTMIGFGEVMIR